MQLCSPPPRPKSRFGAQADAGPEIGKAASVCVKRKERLCDQESLMLALPSI